MHGPYYERQISKCLYFPSCKIWKWANIKVSMLHIRKNLECVFIIKEIIYFGSWKIKKFVTSKVSKLCRRKLWKFVYYERKIWIFLYFTPYKIYKLMNVNYQNFYILGFAKSGNWQLSKFLYGAFCMDFAFILEVKFQISIFRQISRITNIKFYIYLLYILCIK